MDTANAPIFGIDTQGNVNEWNEMTAEITGFSTDFALGKPLGMFGLTFFIIVTLSIKFFAS